MSAKEKVEMNIIINELKLTLAQIKEEDILQIIKEINKDRPIFVYGTGRSGLMLKAFAMRLMQLDYNVYVIGETVTPAMKEGNLLIVASASGETKNVINVVETAIRVKTHIITILADAKSKLGKLQKPTVIISSPTKYSVSKSSVQPLGSLFEQTLLLLCDSLILKMSQQNIDPVC